MIRTLLPVMLTIIGTGAGIGAGVLLAPPAAEDAGASEAPQAPSRTAPAETEADTSSGNHEFVKLNNQFVVPIVEGDRIGAMIVLSLSVEVDASSTQVVYAREPKLRDGFLQVLFDHANRGGFDGAFTNANSMGVLRRLLLEAARERMDRPVHAVLITEIARQEV